MKAKKYKVMMKPNISFTQGLTIEKDTDLIEEFEDKASGVKGRQVIKGGVIETDIVVENKLEEDGIKYEDKTVTKVKMEVPVGTKMIWNPQFGFVRADETITTPAEVIKQLKTIGE